MKKQLLFFILVPFLGLSQVQIGQDIDGEAAEDEFGHSLSLSSDGNILAVGAIYNSENALGSGHVRIYENQSGVWTQIGQDIDGEAAFDQSGYSLGLSSDGNIVAIGANFNSGNGNSSGHVRIYENQSGVWTQIGQDIDGEAADDRSGSSLDLSSNGNIVAIGAVQNDGNGNRSGHVRIYENQSGVWTQIGQDIDGDTAEDQSGYSVSLSSDGSIVAIGSIFNDENGINSGQVRIFENQLGVWTQIGSDIYGYAPEDFFGRSLSLSSNGSVIAIGASQNDGNGDNSGHVRVYENQSGVWTQIGQDIEGEGAGDLSGYSVSLSSDGGVVAIGAPFNIGVSVLPGHVRIYKNQSDVWTQLGADIDGESDGDLSGASVSLSADGSIVAIGGITNDGNGFASGHVRVYDLSAELSIKEQTISSFNIYPNPTKNQFTIQLASSTDLENVNIYNNLGQLVFTSKQLIVDTSKLVSGLYLVEIENTEGKTSKKLIIE
jgi:hypothetical protein